MRYHVNREALSTTVALSVSVPSSPLLNQRRKAYAGDTNLLRLMGHLANPSRKSLSEMPLPYRFALYRYTTYNGMLYNTAVADDTPRDVVPDHTDLSLCIMFEYHDAPSGGHRDRYRTYLTVSPDFYRPRLF